VRETITEHPAMILNGNVVSAYIKRTLTLGFINVIAESHDEGYDVVIDRGIDPQVWFTADDWPVIQQMVASQFAWSAAFRKGGE
jgi:hypothetical protein